MAEEARRGTAGRRKSITSGYEIGGGGGVSLAALLVIVRKVQPVRGVGKRRGDANGDQRLENCLP